MLRYENTISLNGVWDFKPGFLKCDNIFNYTKDDENWSPIDVPYFWNGSKWMSILGKFHTENGYYKDGLVPPFKDHLDIGWYRKKITLPDKWKGKRIHVRFIGVAAKAMLWVNGKAVGEHLGAYSAFGFEITDYIDYQIENTIVVKVWGKHCFYPYDQRVFDQGGIHMYVPGRTLETAIGETRDNAGIYQPVEIYATDAVYIKELEISRTSDPLKVRACINGKCYNRDSLAVTVKIIDKQSSKIVCQETRYTGMPEENIAVTFVFREHDIKLWSPEEPYMYSVEVQLQYKDENWGNVIKDTGFKEFTIRDKKFYLNGKPYFLRGGGSPVNPVIVHDDEYIFKFLNMCKELNLNCVRFHTEPPSQAWLKCCDELGLLAIFEMPLMQQTPEVVNTRKEFAALVKQAKHHPSIAIYCLANEINFKPDVTLNMTGYDAMGTYLNDLRAAVLEEDDTLPVYHDSGYATDVEGGNGDIRDWHIYCGWYENCIYSYEAIMKGIAVMEMLSPKAFDEKAPRGLKDKRNNRFWRDIHKPLILTELIAAYTDDDGHFFQYPIKVRRIGRYRDKDNKKALWYQAFLLKEVVEILRCSRDNVNNLSGVSPFALFNWFFNPLDKYKLLFKPAAFALKNVMEPAHASIKCWNRHKFGNDFFKAEIYLINDDVVSGNFRNTVLNYNIKIKQGNVLAKGNIFVDKVDYYEIKVMPIAAKIPDIPGDSIVEAEINVEWKKDDIILSSNKMDLLIAPEKLMEFKRDKRYGKIYIYDTEGQTTPILDRIGLLYERINSIKDIKVKRCVLIIGANSLGISEEEKILLNGFIKNGASVLVLEQDVYDIGTEPLIIDWIDDTPISIIKEGEQVDDFVHVNDFKSPIFNGLKPEHFRMWNGNTVVISSFIKQGTEENHQKAKTLFGSRAGFSINKLPNVKTYVECFNFLRYDGLIEIQLGRGKIMFSQLEACRRYGDDPVATVYLNNLFEYLVGGQQII